MKRLGFVLVASMITLGAVAATQAATANLHIEGMTCGGCATAVKLVLQKTEGVNSSTVSYEEKRAVVTYDPAKTTPARIAKSIATALAYDVTVESPQQVRRSAEATSIVLPAYQLERLRNEFNASSDRVRVVALLSPTCGVCQKGQRVVQSVFAKYPEDPRLRGFVVWLPMLAGDSEKAAGLQAASFVDQRVEQQWDGSSAAGRLLAKTLELKGNAWDVYLLYAAGVKWTGDAPPAPTFWMHQLRADTGADQRICLNPAVFMEHVTSLLQLGKKG
jgi:copper chaperone CopZ